VALRQAFLVRPDIDMSFRNPALPLAGVVSDGDEPIAVLADIEITLAAILSASLKACRTSVKLLDLAAAATLL
jgi:hypothetical protein